MEAFYIGACSAFIVRNIVLKQLRWPAASRPWRIIPEMIMGGLFMSSFDLMRRLSLQNIMYKEQMIEIRTQLRKDQKNYDI